MKHTVSGKVLGKIGGSAGGVGLVAMAVLGAGIPVPAQASDWGCQVVLCLATPGSPMTYAECVEPITKLYKTLASGGSFPTCSEGGVSSSSSQTGKHTYTVSVTNSDGSTSTYSVNTKTGTTTTK